VDAEALPRDDFGQGLTVHPFHRQEVDTLDLVDGMDGHDVRMTQHRDRLRLPVEPREPVGVFRHLGGEDLQRHLSPELLVGGQIDLSHSPGTDPVEDLVVKQRPAGHQDSRAGWRCGEAWEEASRRLISVARGWQGPHDAGSRNANAAAAVSALTLEALRSKLRSAAISAAAEQAEVPDASRTAAQLSGA